jgi:ribosomal protein L11 methyltransferase
MDSTHLDRGADRPAESPDDIILRLDPGMAFGTGLHPTTQMCLQALEMVVQPGQRVLDLGTGSGILGIAALKLGADWVLAVDNDKLAVKTAVANAAANGVADRFEGQLGTLADIGDKTGTWCWSTSWPR